MKRIIAFSASIAEQARRLIAQAEAAAGADTALAEAAGLVYVGDIYSLRDEDMKACKDDGWGARRYSSDHAPAL